MTAIVSSIFCFVINIIYSYNYIEDILYLPYVISQSMFIFGVYFLYPQYEGYVHELGHSLSLYLIGVFEYRIHDFPRISVENISKDCQIFRNNSIVGEKLKKDKSKKGLILTRVYAMSGVLFVLLLSVIFVVLCRSYMLLHLLSITIFLANVAQEVYPLCNGRSSNDLHYILHPEDFGKQL